MSHSSITQQVYNYLKDKRGRAYLLTLAFLLLCRGAFFTATIRADIKTMLPEGEDGSLSRDFALLSDSSLDNNVFITDRKSTRLNSSHELPPLMPSSA